MIKECMGETNRKAHKQKTHVCHGAWIYLIVVVILYFGICLTLGRPGWILSVFLQNTVSDLTGETPRMMVASYFDRLQFLPMATEEYAQLTQQWDQAIMSELPMAFLFSCIDSFIISRLKLERFTEKVVCFAAAYFLQALIVISCVEPIEWGDAITNSTSLITSIWILGGVIYFIYEGIIKDGSSKNFDFSETLNKIVNVMMNLVYVIFKEAIKIIFLVSVFSLSLQLINMGLTRIGLGHILDGDSLPVIILSTTVYILLNRGLNSMTDMLSEFFLRIITHDTDPAYRRTFPGEIFCFVSSMIIVVNAWILTFKSA